MFAQSAIANVSLFVYYLQRFLRSLPRPFFFQAKAVGDVAAFRTVYKPVVFCTSSYTSRCSAVDRDCCFMGLPAQRVTLCLNAGR